jgi:hypothetical protein
MPFQTSLSPYSILCLPNIVDSVDATTSYAPPHNIDPNEPAAIQNILQSPSLSIDHIDQSEVILPSTDNTLPEQCSIPREKELSYDPALILRATVHNTQFRLLETLFFEMLKPEKLVSSKTVIEVLSHPLFNPNTLHPIPGDPSTKMSSLAWAITQSQSLLIQILMPHPQVNPNYGLYSISGNYHLSPLEMASRAGNCQLASLLLSTYRVDPGQALHIACFKEDLGMAETLLQYGVPIGPIFSNIEPTPFQLALKTQCFPLIRLLANKISREELHTLFCNELTQRSIPNLLLIQTLISAEHFDPNYKEKRGARTDSPLSLALKTEQFKIIKLLLKHPSTNLVPHPIDLSLYGNRKRRSREAVFKALLNDSRWRQETKLPYLYLLATLYSEENPLDAAIHLINQSIFHPILWISSYLEQWERENLNHQDRHNLLLIRKEIVQQLTPLQLNHIAESRDEESPLFLHSPLTALSYYGPKEVLAHLLLRKDLNLNEGFRSSPLLMLITYSHKDNLEPDQDLRKRRLILAQDPRVRLVENKARDLNYLKKMLNAPAFKREQFVLIDQNHQEESEELDRLEYFQHCFGDYQGFQDPFFRESEESYLFDIDASMDALQEIITLTGNQNMSLLTNIESSLHILSKNNLDEEYPTMQKRIGVLQKTIKNVRQEIAANIFSLIIFHSEQIIQLSP